MVIYRNYLKLLIRRLSVSRSTNYNQHWFTDHHLSSMSFSSDLSLQELKDRWLWTCQLIHFKSGNFHFGRLWASRSPGAYFSADDWSIPSTGHRLIDLIPRSNPRPWQHWTRQAVTSYWQTRESLQSEKSPNCIIFQRAEILSTINLTREEVSEERWSLSATFATFHQRL